MKLSTVIVDLFALCWFLWLALPSVQWVQSPVLMAWSHVGSRATWQRQCWIELCWPQLTPPSCPCCWSFPDRNCIASQAVQLQTLLHSCPTPPQSQNKKEKRQKRWEQPCCVSRQLGRCCVRSWVLSPCSASPHAWPLQHHIPTLAQLGHGKGRGQRVPGPAPAWWWWMGMQLPKSTGGDGDTGTVFLEGWALPPRCQLHPSLQKSCVREGSNGSVLVWGQQCLVPAATQDLQGATVLSWLLLFPSGLQCRSAEHLKHFDNPYSLPNTVWRYPHRSCLVRSLFILVWQSDLSLPLSCESPCGWECCGGCGSRLEQGLSAHIACYHRTECNRALVHTAGLRLLLDRSNESVPEVAKLAAVTAVMPNAHCGVQLMVTKRSSE